MELRRSGYSKKSLLSNISLGVFDGISSSLWCYAFATIIFASTLSAFLPLGLVIILGGWGLLTLLVALTSKANVHMASIDDQAVVIIGSIALLMVSSFGDEAVSPRGISTLLAVMAITSLSVSICLYCASRFHLSRLLELLPYPVICGFMAGIGWLMLDAFVTVIFDVPISLQLWSVLQTDNNGMILLIYLACGLFLITFTSLIKKAWVLPLASCILVSGFYGYVLFTDYDIASLRSDRWLFNIEPSVSVFKYFSSLEISKVDLPFIYSVIPQMVTIVFLTLLTTSMNLSALATLHLKAGIKNSEELKVVGGGNFLCALIASPPGTTDATATILLTRFGASTRWMPITAGLICLLVAFGGSWLINYTPRVLIAATILLFVVQLFYSWLYANVRSFSALDYAVVCIILLTIITVGFMHGIVLGFILAVFIFVLRYSMISAIQARYTLREYRSSVERSVFSNRTLNKFGSEALIYLLRGYLFFGTANSIRDRIREQVNAGGYHYILLDFRHVTGIDVSAMNALVQIKSICDQLDIQLLYACNDKAIVNNLKTHNAASLFEGKPQIYDDADFAVENMEDRLISLHGDDEQESTIQYHLTSIMYPEEKIMVLADLMVREGYRQGEYLFHQGDPDSGFYVLISGSMSAFVNTDTGQNKRLRKFSPGSIIGEMSSYSRDKKRSASVVADVSSVVYYLDPNTLDDLSLLHELVARTLGERVEYMNRRLLWEIRQDD